MLAQVVKLLCYTSDTKFDVRCGWPSFDEEIKEVVVRTRVTDGHRVEITCSRCEAHLGYAFVGEGFTQ